MTDTILRGVVGSTACFRLLIQGEHLLESGSVVTTLFWLGEWPHVNRSVTEATCTTNRSTSLSGVGAPAN